MLPGVGGPNGFGVANCGEVFGSELGAELTELARALEWSVESMNLTKCCLSVQTHVTILTVVKFSLLHMPPAPSLVGARGVKAREQSYSEDL